MFFSTSIPCHSPPGRGAYSSGSSFCAGGELVEGWALSERSEIVVLAGFVGAGETEATGAVFFGSTGLLAGCIKAKKHRASTPIKRPMDSFFTGSPEGTRARLVY